MFPQSAGARRESQLESPETAGRSGLHCGGACGVLAGPGAHGGSPVPQPFRSVLVSAFTAAVCFTLEILKSLFSTVSKNIFSV